MVSYSAVLLFLPHFQTREFSQRLKCDLFSNHSFANWDSQAVHNLNVQLKSSRSEVFRGCFWAFPLSVSSETNSIDSTGFIPYDHPGCSVHLQESSRQQPSPAGIVLVQAIERWNSETNILHHRREKEQTNPF